MLALLVALPQPGGAQTALERVLKRIGEEGTAYDRVLVSLAETGTKPEAKGADGARTLGTGDSILNLIDGSISITARQVLPLATAGGGMAGGAFAPGLPTLVTAGALTPQVTGSANTGALSLSVRGAAPGLSGPVAPGPMSAAQGAALPALPTAPAPQSLGISALLCNQADTAAQVLGTVCLATEGAAQADVARIATAATGSVNTAGIMVDIAGEVR